MKFDVVQLESTGIDVIDGDRGKNYPQIGRASCRERV